MTTISPPSSGRSRYSLPLALAAAAMRFRSSLSLANPPKAKRSHKSYVPSLRLAPSSMLPVSRAIAGASGSAARSSSSFTTPGNGPPSLACR